MNRLLLITLTFMVTSMPLIHADEFDFELETSNAAPHILRGYKDSDHETRVICQRDIPFVARKSGVYRLDESVHWDHAGAAITISASNVKLQLHAASICLADPNGVGILVNNPNQTVTEVSISGDAIRFTSPTVQNGMGIVIQNAQKVNIEDVFVVGGFNGLRVQNSIDVEVSGSELSNSIDAAIYVSNSACVSFVDTSVMNAGLGVLFTNEQGPNQDSKIVDCCFSDTITQNVLALQINGLIIDRCAFTNTGPFNTENLVQLGSGLSDQFVTNATVRNSTFTNRAVVGSSLEGLALVNGQNFLVDSCVFSNNNAGQPALCNDFSGIHIAGSGFPVSGFVIRNCVIQGTSIDGIYPDILSTNGLIERNLTSGVLKDGILLDGTTFTTVQYNTSCNNGRNGVGLAQTSTSNAVLNNVTSGNAADGIFISTGGLNPAGCPGGPFDPSINNTVQYNTSFSNGTTGVTTVGFGINDQASAGGSTALNKVFYNTAYNNIAGEYNGVLPITTIVAPGDAAVAGQNIEA